MVFSVHDDVAMVLNRKRTNKRDAHPPDDDENEPNVFLSLSDAQEAMLRLKASQPFWQLSLLSVAYLLCSHCILL